MLPPLPSPVQFVGVPDTTGADRIFVTKADLAGLAVWIVGVRGWIASASACLATEAK